MTAPTAIVVGVSGVGKSTFINSLSEFLSFQYLSAGTLIKQEKERLDGVIARDALRFVDISDNQKLLVDGFRNARDDAASLIVLDGHTVIDTPNGLQPIPVAVFKSLDIRMFVFLKADPANIKLQRDRDGSRSRPILTVEEIDHHQETALAITVRIADELSLPFATISYMDGKALSELLRDKLSL